MLSVDPMDYENPEMEIWLLTYLYYHRRDQSVIARELLENMPPSLLKTLPNQTHLHYMVTRFIRAGYFKEMAGTYRAGSNYHLFITDFGIMEFRKQLLSVFQTSKEESKLNAILDDTVGNEELKESIKEFFIKNKNSNEDEFDAKLHDFCDFLGNDSVIWIFKLILAGTQKK